MLLHAADAAPDGCRKLNQAWRVGMEQEGTDLTGTVLPVDRGSLSMAMGRDNVVHIAITDKKAAARVGEMLRSEEHTSELQSLMRISYAVFCLKKKKI